MLSRLGERRRDGQVLIGFAADHGETGLARAREKLAAKRSDDALRIAARICRRGWRADAPTSRVRARH